MVIQYLINLFIPINATEIFKWTSEISKYSDGLWLLTKKNLNQFIKHDTPKISMRFPIIIVIKVSLLHVNPWTYLEQMEHTTTNKYKNAAIYNSRQNWIYDYDDMN